MLPSPVLPQLVGHQLADIAQLTGGKLAFIYPDGTQIPIDPDPPEKDDPATPDAPADDSPGELSRTPGP